MTTAGHALPDDLLALEVNADPYPFFRALREQDPVHWSDRHRAWLLTGYDDCSAALMNFKSLSSDRVRPLLDVMSDEQRAAAGPVYEMITRLDGGHRSAGAPPPAQARFGRVQSSPGRRHGGQDPGPDRREPR